MCIRDSFPDVPFLIGAAVMQPFLLKALYIAADIRIDRLNPFQHQLPQHIFPDIVCRTGASTAFVAGAYIVVLLAVKVLTGSKVQLISAIGTEQKPGEQSLPFRFCGTAFVFSQLLHPVPLSLRNDCFLRIREDTHIPVSYTHLDVYKRQGIFNSYSCF